MKQIGVISKWTGIMTILTVFAVFSGSSPAFSADKIVFKGISLGMQKAEACKKLAALKKEVKVVITIPALLHNNILRAFGVESENICDLKERDAVVAQLNFDKSQNLIGAFFSSDFINAAFDIHEMTPRDFAAEIVNQFDLTEMSAISYVQGTLAITGWKNVTADRGVAIINNWQLLTSRNVPPGDEKNLVFFKVKKISIK